MADLKVVAIERIAAPGAAEFSALFVRPQRPVVLHGLGTDWPVREWTLDLLERDFGGVSVQVALTRNGAVIADRRRGVLHRRTRLGDYIATLRSGGETAYLMAPADELPEAFRRAAPMPEYCQGSAWHTTKFWLSQAATVSAMHRDLADNLHTQIFGHKRFTLIAPRESACVYPNSLLASIPNGCQVDIEVPDFERFPRLAAAHLMVAELEPGDTIYIPRRWWHHVRTTSTSLSVNHWSARGGWAMLVKAADVFKRLRGISR